MASVVVPEQFILSLYDDCDTNLFICTNCGKKEPEGVEFSECSQCNAAPYCSRDCQVKHWKQHKLRCQKKTDELKQAMGKLPGRVRRFTAYFGPIVNKILLIEMALLQLRNCRDPHFGMLMITELPQEARKPRLKISEAAAKPMSDLPPQYRQHLEFGVKQYPPGTYVIPYVLSVATPCGNYMTPGLNAFEVNPFINPRENLPRDKAALEALGAFWLNTLNDLAEGRRPDLFSAIKRKIKAQV